MSDRANAGLRGTFGFGVLIGLEFLQGCGQKAPVPASSAAEPPPAEAPAAGSTLPKPASSGIPTREGSRCAASSSRSGGSCVVASPGTACGTLRCGADKPGCRYDRKQRRGECVAVGDAGDWSESVMSSLDDHTALLRCASPKDCAGERCCTGGPLPMTACAGSCMSGIDVCDTIADCPEFLGPPTGCEADPAHPQFLKTCRYRAP
jgi:hypothetical protein